MEARILPKHFAEEISLKDTRTSLVWINEDKFFLEEFSIQQVAQITHHRIEVGIGIGITVEPKNQDSQEQDSKPTLAVLSLEKRCGMIVKHMYLSLEAFATLLYS